MVANRAPRNMLRKKSKATIILFAIMAFTALVVKAEESTNFLPFTDFDETTDTIIEFPLQYGERRNLKTTTNSSKFVRPEIKSITNGGKLTIKFDKEIDLPADMVEQLNANKDSFVLMQLQKEGVQVQPIPTVLPAYPVPEAEAALSLDPTTGEQVPILEQNTERLESRSKAYDLTDWEALSSSSRHITFRMQFAKPELISAEQDSTDTIHITLKLQDFKTSAGLYIPKDSKIKRNLPAQLSVDTAETYEQVGNIVSWVFLGLMGMNGGLNTMFDELDYSALMDAVEGPQLLSYMPAMDFKMPPEINQYLSMINDAASIEPSDKFNNDEVDASMSDNVFGDMPISEPLNDRLATLGFDSMTPTGEIGTISVQFAMQLGGIIVLLICVAVHRRSGSMLCLRWSQNLQSFMLWGTLINLILIAYLPTMISMFISTVGLQWEDTGDYSSAIMYNNLWTIFMLNTWLLCPLVLFIVFYRNRNQVGEQKKVPKSALLNRDASKVKWKKDWLQYAELAKTGNPKGVIDACQNKKSKKSPADSQQVRPVQEEEPQLVATVVQSFEGGEAEHEEERHSLMGVGHDSENPGQEEKLKKNAWKLCGKMMPAWLVPRKRNSNDEGQVTRAREITPCMQGMTKGDRTKEDQWAGDVDKDYGEFYKKMSLNEKKNANEVVLFYNFFNIYRKLVFAISLVYFNTSFPVQLGSQLVCSGVMTAYIFSYWPCARYIDNVSKIVNEMTFLAMLTASAYLKEMKTAVNDFTPNADQSSLSSSIGTFMVVLTSANLAFHGVRLVHNSVQAAQTIKARRQQLASKWMGPPTDNDPEYSNDESSGDEYVPEPEKPKEPEDNPSLYEPVNVKEIEVDYVPDQKDFGEQELEFPKPIVDRLADSPDVTENPVPKIVIPRSDSIEEIIPLPDFEIDIPKFVGAIEVEIPDFTIEEDSWPVVLQEPIPSWPGQANPLDIDYPKEPESVPGEPINGQDRIVPSKDEDHIILEYGIEYPAEIIDYTPAFPGNDSPGTMPVNLGCEIQEPTIPVTGEWPLEVPEYQSKVMPKWPKTIYHDAKMTLGKPPKPLKPKPFQKVINTIPMPMRIKNVPFKPVGDPRGKQPGQSPNKRPPAPVLPPPEDIGDGLQMPVRKPEKNQIALQQLTLADSQRYERVILGDVDWDTENLLNTLKAEGRIQAFRLQGAEDDPQAEVILNGGLVNMTKFGKMRKKQDEAHGLGRVTNQLLHEQMVRTNYHTTQGANGERFGSASPDNRSPVNTQKGNFVGNGLTADSSQYPPSTSMPSQNALETNPSMQKTFQEQHSPIHQKLNADVMAQDTSPRIDLERMALESRQRRERFQDPEQIAASSDKPTSSMQNRPQTNSDARQSPYNQENPASRGGL